jgi:hypothetical protein
MTSFEDASMFGSNFGLQSTNNQPHLNNFGEYTFAVDPANTVTTCRHGDLQEILESESSANTMANISKGHALQSQTPPTSTSSSCDADIEKLQKYAQVLFQRRRLLISRREFKEMMKRIEMRDKKVEKLYKMLVSLVSTVAKQGSAM